MVARTLFFNPLLTRLADEIVAGMAEAGVKAYNSLHLRIEKDARDWSAIMGGAGVSHFAFMPAQHAWQIQIDLATLSAHLGHEYEQSQ